MPRLLLNPRHIVFFAPRTMESFAYINICLIIQELVSPETFSGELNSIGKVIPGFQEDLLAITGRAGRGWIQEARMLL